MAPPGPASSASSCDRLLDINATLLCWAWFLLGFILFFSWRYLFFAIIAKNPENHFQRLNCQFYRIFFRILRLTAPRQKIEIDDRIAGISSAVIVCNHLSYLDPLLLIALFPRHKTIVKTSFFATPIFGWMIARAGYLPATAEGRFSRLMLDQMAGMGDYLQDGGNLFIFPEGTRSRDGRLGDLNTGALKIARMCRVPIYVLELRNTDRLFTPGRFWFNTREPNTISVRIIKRLEPDYLHHPPTIAELLLQVRQAYLDRQQ
jgi:1-acyl-sn-glycerol-3-phosphate acyltransferase